MIQTSGPVGANRLGDVIEQIILLTQDVIGVARKGEAPVTQIVKDFGLSVTTLKRRIAIAERKDSGPARLRQSRPRCES